ncbi:MAG: hypothetical protein ACI8UO_001670 [Verrucomicrobiales bacterium]
MRDTILATFPDSFLQPVFANLAENETMTFRERGTWEEGLTLAGDNSENVSGSKIGGRTTELGIEFEGRVSTWGGRDDAGVAPSEGLALLDASDLLDKDYAEYFIEEQPANTTGLARRLKPESFYIACRWDYKKTSKEFLRSHKVTVKNPKTGKSIQAQPVDWGPHSATGRVADVSPGVLAALGLGTDENVVISIPGPEEPDL